MALPERYRAARMETTTRWQVNWVRRFALKNDTLFSQARVRHRDDRKQSLCIWMPWKLQHIGHCANLDDTSQIHHRHTVGKITHCAKVMRDKDDRNTARLSQVRQKIDDLSTDGNIQHGHRFICQQDVRLKHKRARNHHALALPA